MNRAELSALLNAIIEQKNKLKLIPGIQSVKCRMDRDTGKVKVEIYAAENDERFEELVRQQMNPEYAVRIIKVPRKNLKKPKKRKKIRYG